MQGAGESFGGSVLLLATVTLILFRPKDIPIIARGTGRAVGLTIRALKKGRDYADEALQRSARESQNNSNLANVSTSIRSSMSMFSNLASAVRRDLADVPMTPTSYIRSRMQSAARQGNTATTAGQTSAATASGLRLHPRPALPQSAEAVKGAAATSATGVMSQASTSSAFAMSASRAGGIAAQRGSAPSGADFIARSIQEAALAEQQRKAFPTSPPTHLNEDNLRQQQQ